jgi:hypothetical protein
MSWNQIENLIHHLIIIEKMSPSTHLKEDWSTSCLTVIPSNFLDMNMKRSCQRLKRLSNTLIDNILVGIGKSVQVTITRE